MNPQAYIRGVLDGDATVQRYPHSRPKLVLRVVSKGFADFFSEQVQRLGMIPRFSENDQTRTFNGYTWTSHVFHVRVRCDESFISSLRMMIMITEEEKLSYLIGFFHSEGHFHIKRYEQRECWLWRVSNKDTTKLHWVCMILEGLGINAKISNYPPAIPFVQVQRKSDIQRLQSLGVEKK